jgi:hypothetical protein
MVNSEYSFSTLKASSIYFMSTKVLTLALKSPDVLKLKPNGKLFYPKPSNFFLLSAYLFANLQVSNENAV